jgi:dTDP-4-dehydrorhamnose 3,5-epimerase
MARIQGLIVTPLTPHADERGVFTEVFRGVWPTSVTPIQWNVVTSQSNVLRGVHVHAAHSDYLTCIAGELFVGVRDIRPDSPTFDQTAVFILREDEPSALTIPPGVAHGFASVKPTRHLYSMSHYWNPNDDLACRWDDAELGIEWPVERPLLSARDDAAGSFADMVAAFAATQRGGA